MFLGHIAGFVFLPVSIILFLNSFGVTRFTTFFGIDMVLIAAIGMILVEIGDILDSHLKGSYVILSWVICAILCVPALVYFASKIFTFPAAIVDSLPLIMASFLFVEGLTSFYIGGS
jgi:hypothetical protein